MDSPSFYFGERDTVRSALGPFYAEESSGGASGGIRGNVAAVRGDAHGGRPAVRYSTVLFDVHKVLDNKTDSYLGPFDQMPMFGRSFYSGDNIFRLRGNTSGGDYHLFAGHNPFTYHVGNIGGDSLSRFSGDSLSAFGGITYQGITYERLATALAYARGALNAYCDRNVSANGGYVYGENPKPNAAGRSGGGAIRNRTGRRNAAIPGSAQCGADVYPLRNPIPRRPVGANFDPTGWPNFSRYNPGALVDISGSPTHRRNMDVIQKLSLTGRDKFILGNQGEFTVNTENLCKLESYVRYNRNIANLVSIKQYSEMLRYSGLNPRHFTGTVVSYQEDIKTGNYYSGTNFTNEVTVDVDGIRVPGTQRVTGIDNFDIPMGIENVMSRLMETPTPFQPNAVVTLNMFTDLEMLLRLYSQHNMHYEPGYSVLKNFLHWYKKEPSLRFIEMLTVEGHLELSGLFVIIDKYDIYVSSLINNDVNIKRILLDIPLAKHHKIKGVSPRHLEIVQEAFKEANIFALQQTRDVYAVFSDEVKKWENRIPGNNMRVTAGLQHLHFIYDRYDKRTEGFSKLTLARMILYNITVAFARRSHPDYISAFCARNGNGYIDAVIFCSYGERERLYRNYAIRVAETENLVRIAVQPTQYDIRNLIRKLGFEYYHSVYDFTTEWQYNLYSPSPLHMHEFATYVDDSAQ